jgi:chemotaxis protein methyltransferase CheR
MTDAECSDFLQWALPQLQRRWAGYRNVRRLVAKRLRRRLRELALADLGAYRSWLAAHPEEWRALDALLGIPISRFWRDRGVFESLEREVLPALARAALTAGRPALACWSAGCAAGEEPYTLAILWRARLQAAFPRLDLQVVATDSDPASIERARLGCYAAGSLKELPAELRAAAFEARDGRWCVRAEYRAVELVRQDLRTELPDGPFDLVLLRNVVATYYAEEQQREILARIVRRMRPGAALVLGAHESLPPRAQGLDAWPGARGVFRRSVPAGAEAREA